MKLGRQHNYHKGWAAIRHYVLANLFHIYLPWVKICHSVLNVKALEGVFNQEKALVGAFSVIVNFTD